LDAINSHIPAVVQWRRLITASRNKRARLIYSNEVISISRVKLRVYDDGIALF